MAVTRRLAALLFALDSFRVLAAGPTDQLMARMQNRYNAARTLSIRFVEQYSIQGHPRPAEAGTLTLRKQGKMRWDYTRPSGKLFISDGKNVFLYTARDNRVEKIPLKDTEDMRAPLAFLLGHLDMKKEFRDFRTEERDGGTWLEAAAKNDSLPYSKVEMLITADGVVQQLKVLGRDASELAFTFSDERVNPPVPDRMFRFDIPPGAEVMDSVEFGAQEK
jgi:outer membrane lipoprotein carrier protein